jgi:maleate isomerase
VSTRRIGVLVPAGNPTVEPELYRMAPASVTLHFARLDALAGDPGGTEGMERRTLAYLDGVPAAARSLATLAPGVVVIAHTAVSYLSGFEAEPALLQRVAEHSGAPPLSAARAIQTALQHLGVRRLALAVPYPEVIGAAGRAYWQAAGFEVVNYHRLDGVTNIYAESEARALALGRAADVPAADAVLISGTGLPTAGIVEPLERTLGKPVVTSQTATLWGALRMLGVAAPVSGYGCLLAGATGRPRAAASGS